MPKVEKKLLLTVFVIFILALGIRIINLEIIRDNPFFNYPIMDEKYHDEWAQEIAEGNVFEKAPFYRAPGYPYVLGIIYTAFGHNFYLARLVGIIFGSLSCALIYLVGKHLFSHKTAVFASLLACSYGMFLYYDSMLLSVYLEIFFCLLGMLFLLLWLNRKPHILYVILAGVSWGLASITRPNFLLIVPIFIGYTFITFKEDTTIMKLRTIALLTAGLLSVILPVTLINILIGKDSVFLVWNGGINFFLGNNPSANGWSATSPEVDPTWWGGYNNAIIIAEKALNKTLSPSQVSSYWFNRGLRYIFSIPFDWGLLVLKKMYFLLNSYELPNNQSINTFKTFSPLLRLPVLNYGVVITLGIWGLICSGKNRNRMLVYLFMIVYSLSIVMFFVPSRYRMPLVPFLLIFASHAIFWLVKKIKNKEFRKTALSIIALALIGCFVHTDIFGTHADTVDKSVIHATYGHQFFDSGNFQEAVREYRKALSYDPENVKTLNALGVTHIKMNQYNDARKMFRESLNIQKNSDALFKLGLINMELGFLDSAQIYLTDALVLEHTNPEICYYAGMSYSLDQKPIFAIKYLELSLQYHPSSRYLENIHYNLALVYLDIGKANDARQHLQQVRPTYKNTSVLLRNLP